MYLTSSVGSSTGGSFPDDSPSLGMGCVVVNSIGKLPMRHHLLTALTPFMGTSVPVRATSWAFNQEGGAHKEESFTEPASPVAPHGLTIQDKFSPASRAQT
jgi:hypothetical protein